MLWQSENNIADKNSIAADVVCSYCGGGVGEETEGGTAKFWVGSGSQETENNRRRAPSVWTM